MFSPFHPYTPSILIYAVLVIHSPTPPTLPLPPHNPPPALSLCLLYAVLLSPPPPPTQPFHCLYSSSRFPYRVSLASLTRLIVENQSQSLPVSKPFPSFLTKPHRTTHILIHPSFVPPSLSSLCLRFSATPCLLIAKVFFHFAWLH